MSKLASRLMAVLLAAVAACSEAPMEGLPCPCGTGYVCCSNNVCVPEGDVCAARDETPTHTADSPCSVIESNN
jgi:hypothetical protein